jgi:signal peptidase I
MSGDSKERQKRRPYGLVRTLVEALLIALVIRSFIFQPFSIPSGSMEATLLVGDYLMVSKFSYGFSHYSLPFAPPLFSGRIFASEPRRGDVMVFRHGTQDYIKRLIGLPGDRIQLTGGVISINGTPVTRERVADFVGPDPCEPGAMENPPMRVDRWRETLPEGASYETLECAPYLGFPNNTEVYTVPPGHFFMMGDNRENSDDSRFPDVGFVPFENLIGRARFIFFSVDHGRAAWEFWYWPWSVRWSRLFTTVH